MTDVVRYSHETHAPLLAGWLAARGMPVGTDPALFPAVGLVVNNIAAGFLYQTDSAVVFIENFIADPAALPEARAAALDTLFTELIRLGQELGFKLMLSHTESASVANRAVKHGFTVHRSL